MQVFVECKNVFCYVFIDSVDSIRWDGQISVLIMEVCVYEFDVLLSVK
jgi:hypothetical protein